MLRTVVRGLFSKGRGSELVAKMRGLTEEAAREEEQLKQLNAELRASSRHQQQEAAAVLELRRGIMEQQQLQIDVWAQANTEISAIKRASIRNFAQGLIQLNESFQAAHLKELPTQNQDLKEGFGNTVRLFNTTLNKFHVLPTQFEAGQKAPPAAHATLTNESASKIELKGTIARIINQGWVLKEPKKDINGKEELILVSVLKPATLVVYE